MAWWAWRNRNRPRLTRAYRSQPGVQGDERPEGGAGHPPGRGDAFRDALVQQVVELRDDAEGGDAALGEGPHHLGAVHGFQEYDPRPRRQRKQQIGDLREGVEERQDAQDGVPFVEPDDAEGAGPLGAEVAVRQDHALRVAGRARRVQDHRRVCLGGRARRQGWGRRAAARRQEVGHPRGRAGEQDDMTRPLQRAGRLACRVEIPRGGDNRLRVAVAKHRADLRGVVRGVEGNRDGTEAENAEVSREPAVVILGQDRAAVTGAHPEARQRRRGLLSEGGQVAEGDLFDAGPVAILDRDGVGDSRGDGVEVFVDVGHGGAGPIIPAVALRPPASAGELCQTRRGIPSRAVGERPCPRTSCDRPRRPATPRSSLRRGTLRRRR